MSKHAHPEPMPPCKHEKLKHCAQHDVIECQDCGQEWTRLDTVTAVDQMQAFRKLAEDERRKNPAPVWFPERPREMPRHVPGNGCPICARGTGALHGCITPGGPLMLTDVWRVPMPGVEAAKRRLAERLQHEH